MSTVVYGQGFNLIIRTKEKNHKHLPHCHAVGNGHEARIAIGNFEVLSNTGFTKKDIKKIIAAVKFFQAELMEQWVEYHE